jgi:hypothetical protein
MKKLALALMCLVSVAFFASCTQEITDPKPTISVKVDEGFVQDGDVVQMYTQNQFGFIMTSNPQTMKKLSSLKVYVDDAEWANVDLTGETSYVYTDSVFYQLEREEIIGESVIKAVVTDEAGETNGATITLKIQEPVIPLLGKSIEWVRKGANLMGNTEEEMASYGLQWTGSYKDVYATLKPIDGASLYVCDGNDFAEITTLAEKTAYFMNLNENVDPVDSYRKITTDHDADYNDMLAIINGENIALVLIKHADIETGTYGTQITITGEVK